ncbi:hypothetical protein H1C71_001061 [Ictidomys tridecemlineatus]|nr:hypothetical protein H1C71_001061 [Ictidomys tridecemlineatus]
MVGSAGAAPSQAPKHPPAAQEQELSFISAVKLLCDLRHITAFSGPNILFMPRRPCSCLGPTPFSGFGKRPLMDKVATIGLLCPLRLPGQGILVGGAQPASSNLTSRNCGPEPGAQNQPARPFQQSSPRCRLGVGSEAALTPS